MICLATFKTTSAALMFERTCKASGINTRIVPVPRKLSSSCGLACEFPCDSRGAIDELIDSKRINVAGIHVIDS